MKKKLPENLKRKRIHIMLNEEERKTILENSKKYSVGKTLTDYVRQVCINPNIFIEDMNGRKEVIEKISEYLAETREVKELIRKFCMNINVSKDDINILKLKIDRLSINFEDLKKFASKTLSFGYTKKEREIIIKNSK